MKLIQRIILIAALLIHADTKTDLPTNIKDKLQEFAQCAYSTQETVYNTYTLAAECINNNIPGDFVECGVASGTQVAAMAYACQQLNNKNKIVHLFDSFEGIPLAGPNDDQQPGVGHITHNTQVDHINDLLISSNTVYPQLGNAAVCSIEGVKDRMRLWNIEAFRLMYHKGWFQHVLPTIEKFIRSICLLRLDGDLYESTKVCLEYLYPKVAKGGYVIIDDYALPGCKKAVHEYLEKHNLNPVIVAIPGGLGPVYWRVESR
jgi:hypothetical protein